MRRSAGVRHPPIRTMGKGAIRMEDTVRKLCLTLAAGLAVLSTGALPSRADGLPPGAGMIDRGVYEDAILPQCSWCISAAIAATCALTSGTAAGIAARSASG